MNSGTIIEQRQIILIPFPYSDLSATKKRPALILSNSNYHSVNEDVICCAITSNPENYPNSIEIDNNDLESGKLYLDSRVKPNKIFSLLKDNVIKTMGKLDITKSKEVVEQLDILIEIEE